MLWRRWNPPPVSHVVDWFIGDGPNSQQAWESPTMCLIVCLTWAPTCGFMFLSRDVSASLQFFLFLLTCFCHSPGVVTPVLLPYCSQETLLGTFNNSVHLSFPSCFVFSHHLSLSLYFMIRLSNSYMQHKFTSFSSWPCFLGPESVLTFSLRVTRLLWSA